MLLQSAIKWHYHEEKADITTADISNTLQTHTKTI